MRRNCSEVHPECDVYHPQGHAAPSDLLPEPDQLAALVACMRTSAQETLEALRRRGFVIARVATEEGR